MSAEEIKIKKEGKKKKILAWFKWVTRGGELISKIIKTINNINNEQCLKVYII